MIDNNNIKTLIENPPDSLMQRIVEACTTTNIKAKLDTKIMDIKSRNTSCIPTAGLSQKVKDVIVVAKRTEINSTGVRNVIDELTEKCSNKKMLKFSLK